MNKPKIHTIATLTDNNCLEITIISGDCNGVKCSGILFNHKKLLHLPHIGLN